MSDGSAAAVPRFLCVRLLVDQTHDLARTRPAGRSVWCRHGLPEPAHHQSAIFSRDKGMVIDLYIRVSLVGIELLTIAARIVIASVDTYLRFAEAVNRLDISDEKPGLTELVGDTVESGMRKSTEDGVDDIGKAARSGPVDVAVEVPLTRTEAARGTDHGAD